MPSVIAAGTTAGSAISVTGDTTGNLAFQTNGTTTAMTITTGQNVGIGTTNPGYKLDVTGATSTYIGVASTNASTGSGLFTTNATRTYLIGAGAASGNSNLEFRDVTAGATRMSLDTSGNLGIGAAPSVSGVRLTVLGGGTQLSGGTTAQEGVRVQRVSGACTFTGINNDNNAYNPLAFYTSANETMRITADDRLAIGQTSANGKLQVTATGSLLGIYVTAASNHGVYGEATVLGYGTYGRTFNSSYGGALGFDASNGIYGIIGYTNFGLITNASISVNGTTYTSDARLKENVKPINGALAKLTQLNPVSFDWKANSAKGINNNNQPVPDYGMIAQEVEQVMPDIVYETKSPALPNDTMASQSLEAELGTYKGVDYSRLIPFLTKAIQELKAELDVAKAEIQALKGAQ